MVEILDQEEVPFRVCRWVAWGKWLQDRAVRLAVAFALRQEADLRKPGRSTTGWSWPTDQLLGSAEKVFRGLPQYARLVEAGILAPRGKVPDNVAMLTNAWPTVWGSIQREIATLDRRAFRDQAQQLAANRKQRRARRRVKLRPHEIAYADAFNTLSRGLLRADLTLGEAAELRRRSGSPSARRRS